MTEDQYRAEFDADVTFTNGGRLSAHRFRVDVAEPEVSESDVAVLLVASLALLMVDRVETRNLRVFREPHKGTRGGPSDAPTSSPAPTMVELSHRIEAGMTTYPGLPGPELSAHLSREETARTYAPGTSFAIDRISMVGNTGTYLDSPYHRYADGLDLAELPLHSFAGLEAVVARTAGSGARAVDVGSLAALEVRGKAVLLHTGGDRAWGTPAYGEQAPFLTGAGAQWLVERGAALVGIDSANIDDIGDLSRPAHGILLGARIPVVEHLTGLAQLPPVGARFTAAPPRVARFGTFPVRAFAVLTPNW